MKRIQYVNNEYYHIYNRGVEKSKIFCDKSDYERFFFTMNIFNTIGSTENLVQSKKQNQQGLTSSNLTLVEIEEYCLMPNHFHLMLR